MVGNLGSITINFRNYQNEVEHEVNYHHLPVGKPVVASAAIYDMFFHLLRIIGKEDVPIQVSEPMVQTLHSHVPILLDPLENIEEVHVGFEEEKEKVGKRNV